MKETCLSEKGLAGSGSLLKLHMEFERVKKTRQSELREVWREATVARRTM
jgi:hypothetical protein